IEVSNSQSDFHDNIPHDFSAKKLSLLPFIDNFKHQRLLGVNRRKFLYLVNKLSPMELLSFYNGEAHYA
ncbi:MAG: hypothetical protein RLZZ293_671, partial [Pseudomonadota bacterium]